MKKFRYMYLVVSIMQFLAIFDLPYFYYQMLRVSMLIFGIITLYMIIQINRDKNRHSDFINMIILTSIAGSVLWNPIFPIHLVRGVWQIFNIIFGIIYLIIFAKLKKLSY